MHRHRPPSTVPAPPRPHPLFSPISLPSSQPHPQSTGYHMSDIAQPELAPALPEKPLHSSDHAPAVDGRTHPVEGKVARVVLVLQGAAREDRRHHQRRAAEGPHSEVEDGQQTSAQAEEGDDEIRLLEIAEGSTATASEEACPEGGRARLPSDPCHASLKLGAARRGPVSSAFDRDGRPINLSVFNYTHSDEDFVAEIEVVDEALLSGLNPAEGGELEGDADAETVSSTAPPRSTARLMRLDEAFYSAQGDAAASAEAGARAEIDQARQKTAISMERSDWIYFMIDAAQLKDDIVDTQVMLWYLKHSSSCRLKSTNGKEKDGKSILSSSSIKKIVTMLGRVRTAQVSAAHEQGVDLDRTRPLARTTITKYSGFLRHQASAHARNVVARDVTEGTILDHGTVTADDLVSFVHHFHRIAKGQGPTISNMTFFVTVMTRAHMRMDDLLSTLLAFIQPWRYTLDSTHGVFCIVIMRYKGKLLSGKPIDEPDYHFMIPHKDPTVCGILHLAGHLHRILDEVDIIGSSGWLGKDENGKDIEWDWSNNATWRLVILCGVQSALSPLSGSTIAETLRKAFEACGINTRTRGHWGRKAGSVLIKELGALARDIEKIGLLRKDAFSMT
ncbi:hypothetical protein JCM8547_001497 [Rhodosporidiobolus lusitaniae]